jgi:hypothetical protein
VVLTTGDDETAPDVPVATGVPAGVVGSAVATARDVSASATTRPCGAVSEPPSWAGVVEDAVEPRLTLFPPSAEADDRSPVDDVVDDDDGVDRVGVSVDGDVVLVVDRDAADGDEDVVLVVDADAVDGDGDGDVVLVADGDAADGDEDTRDGDAGDGDVVPVADGDAADGDGDAGDGDAGDGDAGDGDVVLDADGDAADGAGDVVLVADGDAGDGDDGDGDVVLDEDEDEDEDEDAGDAVLVPSPAPVPGAAVAGVVFVVDEAPDGAAALPPGEPGAVDDGCPVAVAVPADADEDCVVDDPCPAWVPPPADPAAAGPIPPPPTAPVLPAPVEPAPKALDTPFTADVTPLTTGRTPAATTSGSNGLAIPARPAPAAAEPAIELRSAAPDGKSQFW